MKESNTAKDEEMKEFASRNSTIQRQMAAQSVQMDAQALIIKGQMTRILQLEAEMKLQGMESLRTLMAGDNEIDEEMLALLMHHDKSVHARSTRYAFT